MRVREVVIAVVLFALCLAAGFVVLSRHLSLPLPGGDTMCMCHSNEQSALFSGPVYYRRHVAERIYEVLGLPGPAPHEPLLTELAKEEDV